MTPRILLSPPDTGALEEEYLVRALRSGWVAPVGPDLTAFEAALADRAGTAHAVAVSSGTAALHLALLSLGVGRGQVVIVPTLTFAATANAVVYTGAEPVFVDCDPATGNVDVALLDGLLGQLRHEGRAIGAVIGVDMFGVCADYAALLPLAESYGVPVIEDAAEALGASYRNRPAGGFGRVGALSFNGNKIITTSGGGAVVTDDGALATHCRYLAAQARQPVPHYEHVDIGYNYRLSNLLAALGRAQLGRLDQMIARRRELREAYAKLFAGIDGVRLLADQEFTGNCWLTVIVVDPRRSGWRAEELALELAVAGIETRPIWKPMHLQPVFAASRAEVTGAAERLFATGLTLPSGSAMSEADARFVRERIHAFLEEHPSRPVVPDRRLGALERRGLPGRRGIAGRSG